MRNVPISSVGVVMVPSSLWFAIQVVARKEKRAALLLEQKGYESFLPTYKVVRKWSDRTKILELPIFPGYVFCRCHYVVSGLIMSTPNVMRIVSFGGNPAPIPQEEIEQIQRVIASGAGLLPHSYLKSGQRVIIKGGPLSGICGIVSYIKSRCRVVLSVEMIMKAIAVEVESSNITVLS